MAVILLCMLGAKDDAGTKLMTLGDVFLEWLPQYFEQKPALSPPSSTSASSVRCQMPYIQAKTPYNTTWKVGGITPSLSTPLLDLWNCLCHPDYILYIVLLSARRT